MSLLQNALLTIGLRGAACVAALTLSLIPVSAADQVKILQTWQVSTNARGQPANGPSSDPAIAPLKLQGRVAFASTATNLTSAKTNGFSNIYVKNVGTGAVSLVTRGFNGEPANGDSFAPVYSPDGKTIAFASRASNLVKGDTNERLDVFMIDRRVGKIRRISTRADRGQLDGNSSGVRFSPDGQSIIFTTDASNILPGKTDRITKVIWKSLKSGRVACVSCTPAGQVGEGLDANFTSDGRRVIFMSHSGYLGGYPTVSDQNAFVANLSTRRVVFASRNEKKAKTNYDHFNGAYAPNGKFIATFGCRGIEMGFEVGSLILNHLPSHKWTHLAETNEDPFGGDLCLPFSSSLSFTPDGTALLATFGTIPTAQLYFLDYTADGAVVTGTGVVSKDGNGTPHEASGTTISPDGRQIAYSDSEGQVFLVSWQRTP